MREEVTKGVVQRKIASPWDWKSGSKWIRERMTGDCPEVGKMRRIMSGTGMGGFSLQ